MQTTAQKLLAFRNELTTAGLDRDRVDEMVRDAAQTIIMNEGLTVQDTPQKAYTRVQDTPQA